MSASLVGSEMCIRDSAVSVKVLFLGFWGSPMTQAVLMVCTARRRGPRAVSYTHLTLPTICSV
eukprot:8187396-Alexandrium_andersonii.AAC.1